MPALNIILSQLRKENSGFSSELLRRSLPMGLNAKIRQATNNTFASDVYTHPQ
jgi:hypothetical protein